MDEARADLSELSKIQMQIDDSMLPTKPIGSHLTDRMNFYKCVEGKLSFIPI